LKRGTPDHPKLLALARALGVHRVVAVGTLELLWHWTARYAPRGDVGRYPDESIAQGVLWDGDPSALTRALAASGWLDECSEHRLIVHDWAQHADDATKKHLSRNNLQFACVSRQSPDKSRQRRTKSRNVTPAVAKPEPLPEPEPLRLAIQPPASPDDDWNRHAADVYKRQFPKGSVPGAMFRYCRPLVLEHGWPEVSAELDAYLERVPIDFHNWPKFASGFGRWTKAPKVRGQPATADNARVLDEWERKIREAVQ
jgi:hypothetical protein